MIALALDTSGSAGSVAVLRDDEVLARISIEAGMRHGVELFPSIERGLRDAGVAARDVDLVAVGVGPGSYTGLRVGVTAARALAFATGADLLGVTSCDALAAAVPAGDAPVGVVVDARVRAVYVATYAWDDERGWQCQDGPEILPPGSAAERLPDDAVLVGDGAAAHHEAFARFGSAEAAPSVDAVHVARLALRRHALGEREELDRVVPLYLRKSTAEMKAEAAGR